MRTERGSAREACSNEQESGRLTQRTIRINKAENADKHSRVDDVCGVVHALPKTAVEVGEGGGRGTELHVLAEVVAALSAEGAVVAHDAGFDGYSLARDEVLDPGADGGDDASSFMTEDEWCLDDEVAITAMCPVVH